MRQWLMVFIISVAALPFLYPFFDAGYFETDDGIWAMVRQASMHYELRNGQFPVRWSGNLNFNYGYPLFQFSYPGPYYIGEVIHVLGFSFTDTIKILFVVGTMFSVGAMFVFAQNLWKSELAGIVAAIFYLAVPYRFVNLYVRGSIGETLAFLLFPIVCHLGLQILQTGKRRYVISGSIAFALLILAHNVMALLFVPFFIYFLAVETFIRNNKFNKLFHEYLDEIKNKKNWYKQGYTIRALYKHIAPVIIMVILGITLSATFWLPALAELQYVKLGNTPLTSVTKEFGKQEGLLLTPLDSHPLSNKENQTGLEENLELVLMILVMTSVTLLTFNRNKHSLVLQRQVLYGIPALICLMLVTPISIPLWYYFPGLKTVDFPWRIFGLLSFLAPVIIAASVVVGRIKYLFIPMGIIYLIFSWKLITPGPYHNNPDLYYATNQATTTSANEYLSRWMTNPPDTKPTEEITLINGQNVDDFTYKVIKAMSLEKEYSYNSSSNVQALFSVMYFPGWELRLDGHGIQIDPRTKNGVIKASLPQGTHSITLSLHRTPARFLGDAITLASIIGIVLLCIIEYARGKKFIL